MLQPFSEEETQNLRARTYTALRKLIVDGALKPGERLSERAIAARLGISTTPIKDALRRLEAEGLIVTLPRKGTYVSAFAAEREREMTLLRAAIEGVTARIAAEKADRVDLTEMREAIDRIREATEKDNFDAVIRANQSFHAAIVKATNNSYLEQLLSVLQVYDQSTRVRILSTRGELMQALIEHQMILQAIESGDGDLAETTMRAHVARSAEVLRSARKGQK
jgi:DNA-binding GntR family transcriptional regulator